MENYINQELNENKVEIVPISEEEFQQVLETINIRTGENLERLLNDALTNPSRYRNIGGMTRITKELKALNTKYQRGRTEIKYLDSSLRGIVPPYTWKSYYGYDSVRHWNGDLKVIPEQAEIVKDIYHTFASSDITIDELVQLLGDTGYINDKGCPFSKTEIRHILKDITYTGYFVNNSFVFKGHYEPIISEELWDSVQKKLGKQTLAVRISENTY